jgi:hypothetical protein
MTKKLEDIKKRQIILEDGRYMIFYAVTSKVHLVPSSVAVSVPEVTRDDPEEEN